MFPYLSIYINLGYIYTSMLELVMIKGSEIRLTYDSLVKKKIKKLTSSLSK